MVMKINFSFSRLSLFWVSFHLWSRPWRSASNAQVNISSVSLFSCPSPFTQACGCSPSSSALSPLIHTFVRNIFSGAYGSMLRSVEKNDLESNRLEIKFQFFDLSYNVWSFLHLLVRLQGFLEQEKRLSSMSSS